jgi:hypothetical protein
MANNDPVGLQIASLAVGALTPLAVAVLGILLDRWSRRIESIRTVNQTVLARRVEVFREVSIPLNRLLCFGTFVGRWKEITTADALSLKREVDEVMYANRLLFSNRLFERYQDFMSCLFAMYATPDGDALIRARISCQWGSRRHLEWWTPESSTSFSITGPSSPETVQEAFEQLSTAFQEDLWVSSLQQPLLPLPPDRRLQ